MDVFHSRGRRNEHLARRLAHRSSDFARHVGSGSADLARRFGEGTADIARRVGPRRGLIGLAIFGAAVTGGILLARYLRERAEELEYDQESMDAGDASMLDAGAGVRRRRRQSRAQRKAATAAISH